MMFLLNCVIKASVILAIALLTVRLLRRQSAAIRHCVLAAGILSASVSPGLSLLMPAWNVRIPLRATPTELPPGPVLSTEREPVVSGETTFPVHRSDASKDSIRSVASAKLPDVSIPLNSTTPFVQSKREEGIALRDILQSHWILQGSAYLWIAGVVLALAVLLAGMVRLTWIAVGSCPITVGSWVVAARDISARYELTRLPRLLKSTSPSILVTWGWRRPKILLPAGSESWPEDRIRAVLCHELAHIRRGDWVVQLTAELLRSVYWFNPIFWAVCKSLRCESEQASDDAALNFGIVDSEYAQHLLEVVRTLRQPSRTWSAALSMANPSSLERRFKAILDPEVKRKTLTRLPIAFTLAAFLAVSLPLSMVYGSAAATAPLRITMRSIAAMVTASPGRVAPISAEQAVLQSTSETDRGTIQGTVRRADLTAPIADVEISLEGGPADPKSVQALIQGVAGRGIVFSPRRIGTVEDVLRDVTDQAGAQGVGPGFPMFDDALAAFRATNAARFIAETDTDGHFTIKDVPSGQYTVHFEREGFFDLQARAGNPPRVTVQAQQTSNVTISLTPGGVVSGHIRDASGEPQQNVNVQILTMVYRNGYPILAPATQKLTDDHGAYRLFWLAPGDYYVAVNLPATPNAGAPLRILYPSTLDVARATPVSIRGGDQITGVDIQIVNDPLPKISGKVTSTIPADEIEQRAALVGDQLGRPTLMLLGRDPSKPDIGAGTARTIGTVTLNSGTGTFEVSGILPGSYDLYVRIPESNANGGAGFAFAKVPVDVKNESVTGLSITVNHSVNVAGTVTVDGKAPGATPIRILLQSEGSGGKLGVYQTVGQRPVSPDAKGAFSIIAVPPGLFRLVMGPGLPPDLYIQDVRQGGTEVFDSGIGIGSDKPNALQVALASGAGTVEGVQSDTSGKPLAGASILLAPLMARRQNRALYHTATSDANGKFTIHNVAPGGYQLFAWQQSIPAGAYFNSGFLSLYEDRGHFVNVSAKSTLTEQINAVPVQ